MKASRLPMLLMGVLWLYPYLATASSNGSPDVKIISPRDGERVHGKISIGAEVSPPDTVEFIDFYIQEPGAKDRYSWKAYRPPYWWGGGENMVDTTLFNDGAASVVAFPWPRDKSWHDDKNRIYFTIDNGKPKIKILNPKSEAEITAMGDISIQVQVSDPKGMAKPAGISAVYIYADGSLLGKLIKTPYRINLNSCLLTPGRHSIRAVAEDTEGLSSTETVMIIINPEASCLNPKIKKQ